MREGGLGASAPPRATTHPSGDRAQPAARCTKTRSPSRVGLSASPLHSLPRTSQGCVTRPSVLRRCPGCLRRRRLPCRRCPRLPPLVFFSSRRRGPPAAMLNLQMMAGPRVASPVSSPRSPHSAKHGEVIRLAKGERRRRRLLRLQLHSGTCIPMAAGPQLNVHCIAMQ